MTFDPKSVSTKATLANGLPHVQMISMCYIAWGRYEFLKIFRLRPCIWPLWPQMTSDEKNDIVQNDIVEEVKLMDTHKFQD